MAAASMVGHGFSVVSTLDRAIPIIEALALKYGFERHCRRVRAASIPVLALEEEGGAAAAKVREQVLAAIEEDRAEAVLLGCAGMTDLADALTRETGVPVIDGVGFAIRMAAGLAATGLVTAKTGAYALPRVKQAAAPQARVAPLTR